MLSLLELQRSLRAALLGGEEAAALAAIAVDGIAAERLDVHRTNVLTSLSVALAETFPVVRRLVDERFFAFAAHEFVCDHPPTTPCVADYGAGFADFLADFPPCRDLVYLADVARLEWMIDRAARAADVLSLEPVRLAGIEPDAAARTRFSLQPSYRYLQSPWPIDWIWRANQPESHDETVDLAAGGVRLEVRRLAGTIEFRNLSPATFVFRAHLAAARPLGGATEAALELDPDFDVAGNFASLFVEQALVEVSP